MMHVSNIHATAKTCNEPDRRQIDIIGLMVIGTNAADTVKTAVNGREALINCTDTGMNSILAILTYKT